MARGSYKSCIAVSFSLSVALSGCSDKKPEPAPSPATGASAIRIRTVEPGVAGGTIDEITTTAVTVVGVDTVTRTVTLADADGRRATFAVGPEIHNLEQLHVGDKLTATLHESLLVYVRSDRGSGGEGGDTYGKALESAPAGAKPGALISENYQIVATVAAIDPAWNTATLRFADGSTRTVRVRSGVDLSRYTVGDRVIIRVTTSLSVLTSRA